MIVLYVAKHNSGGNDDEGAIAHSLGELGHEVIKIHETKASPGWLAKLPCADLLLFHKWYNPAALKRLEGRLVRVFWYFDLVDFPDPTLHKRCDGRMRWMRDVTPHVELGFCTDGDWVARDETHKLTQLSQGADSRITGFSTGETSSETAGEVLFTGVSNGGQVRSSFVEEMKAKYGSRFHHVWSGVYREKLADLIAGSRITVAPDGPVTNKYWSNRVYNALGFGAFLLHPWCEGLAEQYKGGREIVYYRNRNHLYSLMEFFLQDDSASYRQDIAKAGLERTLREHTYSHRCRKLMEAVEQLSISHP